MPSSADNKQLRELLHLRFRALLGSPRGDDVAYHLADLHAGLTHAAETIERIAHVSEAQRADALRVYLAELGGELFEHIGPHAQSVRPPLEQLIADLFDEENRRREL